MQAAGMIEKLSFSLYVSYTCFRYSEVTPPSNLLFGTSDLVAYSTDSSFAYVPLVEGADGWVVELEGLWIDGKDLGNIATRVRFTTGSLLMSLPHSHYLSFLSNLINITTCGQFPSLIINCPCPTQPLYSRNLTLSLPGLVLEVPPAAYFYEVQPK